MNAGLFNPTVEDLFFEWSSHNCDSESNIALQVDLVHPSLHFIMNFFIKHKYDKLPDALKEEYANFFSYAQNISDQKSNFDEETIVLKGFVLRDIMERSTKMVIK